jgi:intracellular sulfur oxidation DsrE/DsrF family protein
MFVKGAKMFKHLLACIFLVVIVASPAIAEEKNAPFRSSSFTTFDDVNQLEQLKVVFDFNFPGPSGVKRALYPVSFTLKAVQEYGPVSFEPVDIIVVSHGSEVVAFAKRNYQEVKEIADWAARLADLGVKFEVCSVAANALGFGPEDFHGFVNVVPTGAYALIYHQNRGYALMPGAASVPGDLINSSNQSYLGN